jgi:hypothetical protein
MRHSGSDVAGLSHTRLENALECEIAPNPIQIVRFLAVVKKEDDHKRSPRGVTKVPSRMRHGLCATNETLEDDGARCLEA